MSECEAVNAPPQDSQDNLVREDESALSCPDSRNDDFRSSAAMEELATLMLEMDIAEGGEPSFTMAPGKRQPALSDLEAERKMEPMRSDERIAIHLLPPELLIHLVDCFVTHFNPYHQFLDRQDVADLKRQGIDVDALDLRFRNAALLAVAACFSSIPEAKKLRSSYASLADGLAFRCIRERPNDIVVQGLTLLAWKELMFGAPSLAYNYIGMTPLPLFQCDDVTGLLRAVVTSHGDRADLTPWSSRYGSCKDSRRCHRGSSAVQTASAVILGLFFRRQVCPCTMIASLTVLLTHAVVA